MVRGTLTWAIGNVAALVNDHNVGEDAKRGKYEYLDYLHSMIGCVAFLAESPALGEWEYDLKKSWTANVKEVMGALKPQASQEQIVEVENLFRVLTNAIETGTKGDPWSFTIRTSGYKLTDAQVDDVVDLATELEQQLGVTCGPKQLIITMRYMAVSVGCETWTKSLEILEDAEDNGKKLTTKQLCDLVKDDVAQFRLFVAQCSTEDQLKRLTAATDVLNACIQKVAPARGRRK
jgi:hypothetical protein